MGKPRSGSGDGAAERSDAPRKTEGRPRRARGAKRPGGRPPRRERARPREAAAAAKSRKRAAEKAEGRRPAAQARIPQRVWGGKRPMRCGELPHGGEPPGGTGAPLRCPAAPPHDVGGPAQARAAERSGGGRSPQSAQGASRGRSPRASAARAASLLDTRTLFRLDRGICPIKFTIYKVKYPVTRLYIGIPAG